MKNVIFLVIFSLSAGCFTGAYAQIVPDTALTDPIPEAAEARADTAMNMDSVLESSTYVVFEPIPKRAGLYSAVLPGMGQVYNRQYWKIPIVVAGMGTVVYFFQDNLKLYQSYRKAYLQRVQNPNDQTAFPQYTSDQLRQLQDSYRQNLDMTVLFGVIGYAAQILDAVAAAHLKNFDISQDISMNMRPVVHPGGVGLGLVMNFK